MSLRTRAHSALTRSAFNYPHLIDVHKWQRASPTYCIYLITLYGNFLCMPRQANPAVKGSILLINLNFGSEFAAFCSSMR
jgi:hypothetical protein